MTSIKTILHSTIIPTLTLSYCHITNPTPILYQKRRFQPLTIKKVQGNAHTRNSTEKFDSKGDKYNCTSINSCLLHLCKLPTAYYY